MRVVAVRLAGGGVGQRGGGLVGAQHLLGDQRRLERLFEPGRGQRVVQAGQAAGDEPGGHLRPEQRGHQIGGAFDAEHVLAGQQGRRGGHVRAVAGWPAPHPRRQVRRGGVSAAAHPAHHLILGDRQGEARQVEHLHPGADRSGRAGQAGAAARAARRLDRLPMVGGGHRDQAAAAMYFLQIHNLVKQQRNSLSPSKRH